MYDISGVWNATQSNGPVVQFHLNQNGSSFDGWAQYSDVRGDLQQSGELSDGEFHCVVFWENGPVGDYQARFGMDGRLRGSTYDVNDPVNQALWHSQKQFSG
jgi:hypothetical protein